MNVDDRWSDDLPGTFELSKFMAPSLYALYRKVIAGEPLTAGGFLGDELDEPPDFHR